MKRIATIVCCYRQSPRTIAESLARIGQRIGTSFDGIIVDNAARSATATIDGWQVLAGSNELMDFSGYCEGLAALESHQGAVLVLNDTLFTDHNAGFMLERLLRYHEFVAGCGVPAIVGKVDRYNSVCFVNPWSGINAYVSSFAFLLSDPALEILPKLYATVSDIMGDALLPVDDPSWASMLDPRFRAYLRLHLLTDFDPLSWYRLKSGAVTADMLARKARCVYLEHRFSGEIAREGIIVSLFPRERDRLAYSVMNRRGRLAPGTHAR
jgi:hypothetical protein